MSTRFLRYADLKERGIVGSRPTLSRWIEKRGFPRPVKLGPNTTAYPADKVEAWLEQRSGQSA